MRRYDDEVEVLRGWVDGSDGGAGREGPEQFLWRGGLWRVRAVVAQWVETGPWWLGARARAAQGDDGDLGSVAVLGDLLDERELWRVQASRGRADEGGGVFDLRFRWSDGSWRLVGCLD